jgi:hypothetical protein
VAVHGEENTMVYLVKQVRMLASTPAPMGVVVLIGGDDGGVSGSIDSEIQGRPPLIAASMGVIVLVGDVEGASRIG